LAEFPSRTPLAKQIPALIQHDLETAQPLAIGVARRAASLALEEFVLLAGKPADVLNDRVVFHRNPRLTPALSFRVKGDIKR